MALRWPDWPRILLCPTRPLLQATYRPLTCPHLLQAHSLTEFVFFQLDAELLFLSDTVVACKPHSTSADPTWSSLALSFGLIISCLPLAFP